MTTDAERAIAKVKAGAAYRLTAREREILAEVEPRCGICGEPDMEGEADWNGETGNHQTCEAWA